MIGTFILFMAKGEKFDKDVLVELYTRQLGLVISRKQAEEKLSQEKILTNVLFTSVPGMMSLYDDQFKLVRWNKKHEEITGYSSAELANISFFDWFKGDKENQTILKESISRVNKYGFSDGEAKMQKKDGTLLPVYITGSVLYLNGKKYFAGITIDITERKKKG